jgi:hypothetical protein
LDGAIHDHRPLDATSLSGPRYVSKPIGCLRQCKKCTSNCPMSLDVKRHGSDGKDGEPRVYSVRHLRGQLLKIGNPILI